MADGRRRRGGNIRHSHMEQPPLIKMLKNILSEYPDGGQILKELIQNAEDAGARQVKLMFDSRRLNDKTGERSPEYTKFFKAPALCVYNDAVFTDGDWKGIRMIYSSVKENEKMKVGKFGLGFKSVFHITDYPFVISGDTLLLINPQNQQHLVNAMMYLRDINDSEEDGLRADDFWRALDDTFGFNKSVVGHGHFPGTLFWFPLREVKSELSETLYNESKVKDLFASIELDAEKLLIFMKNLELISLHRRTNSKCDTVMVAEIENPQKSIRRQRQTFNEKVYSMQQCLNVNEDDLYCFLPMTVCMRTPKRQVKENWYVVNYLVSRSASTNFKAMINDKSAGKCPYVGVAVSLQRTVNGHVFCFLPLPQEGETLTGLPVHVNGFFELNQNRHNLKWDTDEHRGKPIDDPYILWNKALIEEALPMAYEKLLMEAINRLPSLPCEDELRCVYNMLPLCQNSTHAQKRWSSLTMKLYNKLEKQGIIYSHISHEWMHIREVCFATFRDIDQTSKLACTTKDSIKRCLASINRIHADVPVNLFETFAHHFRFVEDLNASKLASYLKCHSGYMSLAGEDKINILNYLLTDQTASESLGGLKLLPLEDGTWSKFGKLKHTVYLCGDDDEVALFPGLSHIIVLRRSQMETSLYNKLAVISDKGTYHIKRMSNNTMKKLLNTLLTTYYSHEKPIGLKTLPLNVAWLEVVWKVIQKKGNIDLFNNVPLVPVLIQGAWDRHPVVELHNHEDLFLYNCTNRELGQCFEALMVTIIPSLPHWIQKQSLKKFAYEATNEGLLLLLQEMCQRKTIEPGICKFNDLSDEAVNSMKQFIIHNPSIYRQTSSVFSFFNKLPLFQSGQTIDEKETFINFVKRLRMFQSKQSMNETPGRSSVAECSVFLLSSDLDVLPTSCRLPWNVIIATQAEENLLVSLGAQRKSISVLVEDILQSFISYPSGSSTHTILDFMDFIVNRFDLFKRERIIVNLAKNIPFLKAGTKLHKPSQLFDPSDKELRELLLGQDLFPERKQGLSEEYVYVLRQLDLKSADKLDGNTLFQVATECDRLSQMPAENEKLKRKSSQLLKLLCDKSSLLSLTCSNGLSLQQNLTDLNWVPVAKRPPDYPSTVPWFSDGKTVCKPSAAACMSLALLVGSQTHIVNCKSTKVCDAFNLRNVSRLETVVAHLEILQRSYDLKLKAEIMHMAKKIYEFISTKHANRMHDLKSLVTGKKFIWTGKGFEVPTKVIIGRSQGDINLEPYFYALPDELSHYGDILLRLGCHSSQNNHILSQTLHEIKRSCDTQYFPLGTAQSSISELILKVLRKLAKYVKENPDDAQQLDLLMLVDNDSNCIELEHIGRCILDDNTDDMTDEDNDFKFVHERVPRQVAIDLGIKSAKSKTLNESINAFQPWGQTEPLTKRIETLLRREYTFGLGVPKELIQNADDAGANVVKFIFDERENNDARDKLLTSAMSECQGSALWVYNDETFSNDDMENIRLLNGGTKAENVETIGKFGLGFCSVYNLTELPCFISGNNLVIFDPQEKYLRSLCETNSPGLKVNLSGRRRHRLIRDHIDQFKPFQDVLGCNPTDPDFNGFNGTLFRFPLRTPNQALSSKLCQIPCLRENILQLLESVVENAGNLLLFTQHVSRLQIFHIPKDGKDPSNPSLIFEINKSLVGARGSVNQNVQCVLSRLHQSKSHNLAEIHCISTEQTYFSNRDVQLAQSPYSFVSSWVVSWTSEHQEISQPDEGSSKHIPISAIALPVYEDGYHKISTVRLPDIGFGFPPYGLLFCFLPLPIQTKMPFHINGYFDVSSDRKRLVQRTADELRGSSGQNWNQYIFEGTTVSSFIQLLEYIAGRANDDYNYHTLWPVTMCHVVNDFRRQFFSAIYSIPTKLFRSSRGWHSSDEIVILHPDMRQSEITNAAFNMLDTFPIIKGKQVIDMHEEVYNAIIECIPDQTRFTKSIVSENDLINHFLDVINEPYWNDKTNDRNSLALFALNMKDKTVLQRLKQIACIPSLPNGTLRRPCDLIDPFSDIAQMFDVSDGFFPEGGAFAEKKIRQTLKDLGMMCKTLPTEIFIDRCYSVSKIGQLCCLCSREQCMNVMKYISKQIVDAKMKDNKALIKTLKNIPILPVLERPSNWSFTWAADIKESSSSALCNKHSGQTSAPLKTATSVELHRKSIVNCIGSIKLIVDENFFLMSDSLLNSNKMHHIYQMLDVNSFVPPQLLRDQLSRFAEEYNSDSQFDCISTSHMHIYSKLQAFIKNPDQKGVNEQFIHDLFGSIRHKPIVLIGKKLVPATCVALEVQNEYAPYLCRLPDLQRDKKHLFTLIGVHKYFSSEIIVDVLKVIKNEWSKNKYIDGVVNVLKNLCESMKRDQLDYKDLSEVKEFIVAPDQNENLLPTHTLVIEDSCFTSRRKMNFLHGHVPPEVGKIVGVKSKQKHAVERFSKLIPFGQKENLATRLRGLLDDYPCDASIMKELLQNADDANATELHFIKDFRRPSTCDDNSKSFGHNAIQPPALCVFNDGYFTEEDFKGIQNLGEGSKQGDPTKTGQYGVGFNTVYHITDSPSFFTKGPGLGPNGTLCIFDPLMKVIPDHVSSEERGIRCDAAEMEEDFPNILGYYMGDTPLFVREQGTLFRLPLRKEKSAIRDKIMTESDIDSYLKEMKEDLFEMLLFVKNVKKIKISRINESNEMIEEYWVESMLTKVDEEKRRSFFTTVWKAPPLFQQMIVNYEMKVVDSNQKESTWCVVQCFGLSNAEENIVTMNDVREDGICQIPLGAIAIPIIDKKLKELVRKEKFPNEKGEHHEQTKMLNEAFRKETDKLKLFTGKAFCFLPLKDNTKFKFHYNGHFVLNRARTTIHKDGVKGRWNQLVLNEAVTKAWIRGMMIIKDEIDVNVKLSKTWKTVNHVMKVYFTLFPMSKTEYEALNPCLAGCIYKAIFEEISALFLVVMRKKDAMRREHFVNKAGIDTNFTHGEYFSLLWTGLAKKEYLYGGVFNDNIGSNDDSHTLGNLLKLIGLKQIDIPLYKVIDSYDVHAQRIDQSSVAKFIATYEDESDGRCLFGEVNVPVENTLFTKKSHLKCLISYIIHDNRTITQRNEGKIPNPINLLKELPLCVTCDGVLRRFDTGHPVYWSQHARLVPMSSSSFLDIDIYGTNVYLDLHTAGLIKEFTVADLLDLLPTSYNHEMLTSFANVPWLKEESNPFSVDFLRNIFAFIEENSQTWTEGVCFTDPEKLKQNLMKMNHWSFIPSVEMANENEVFKLVPIQNGENVLYIDRYDLLCKTFVGIITKIGLPVLDVSVFEMKGHFSTVKLSGLKAIRSIVATLTNPCSFARFLVHHKERINYSNALSVEGAYEILVYFNNQIRLVQAEYAVDLLRCLALFETIQGDLRTLTDFTSAVVLPQDVPSEGLLYWSHKTNTLLLRENMAVCHIYEKLNLTLMNGIEFYTEHILQHMDKLPLDSIMVHIEYIRDSVLPRLPNRIAINQVETILADINFIQVNANYRKAKELYLKSNDVFRAMIDESMFLPEEFTTIKWFDFLRRLGLNVDVSAEQLVQFAYDVAASGVYHVSERTKSQSRVILDFICGNNKVWNDERFYSIRNIKFILPKRIGGQYSAIFPQLDNGERLVCFDGSIPDSHFQTCWTSLNMLPYHGHIPPGIYDRLGVLSSPPLTSVISHCQNICDSISRQLQTQNMIDGNLTDVFLKMYECMSKKLEHIGDNEKQRLRNTEFVLISGNSHRDSMLVKAMDIVVELHPDEEIKPYLWRIPDELSRYRDVFLRLGSTQYVNVSHYLAVLQKIKAEFPEGIPPQKMENVAKCLQGLVALLENDREDVVLEPGQVLYLPNREQKLVKSTDLIISDNTELENRLGLNTRFDYFIGFHDLRIYVSDPTAPFKRLTFDHRPRILTELIEEVVCLENLTPRHCPFAIRLESFLRCPYLMQGVVRLVKHQRSRANLDFGRDDEINITSALANVRVERVTGLQTNITIGGNIVPSSERDKTCFIQQYTQDEVKGFKLYFQFTDNNYTANEILSKLIHEDDGVLDLLNKCTKGLTKDDTYKYLSAILNEMHDPSNIKAILDKKRIAAYNLPTNLGSTVFPPPGTYVPDYFFPFLDRNILFFKEHEFRYVAYDIGVFNSTLDDYNEVFIYAHIIRQVNPQCSDVVDAQYEIDIGEESTVKVPIYRLFNFVSQTNGEIGSELVVYDSEPVGAVAFDEVCRRIRQLLIDAWMLPEEDKRRVIRRLQLKWHPDKNISNTEYATEVYNYLNHVIMELEQTGTPGKQQCYSPANMSNSAYNSMRQNVYRTGCRYAQAWTDNYNSYMGSYNIGLFSHSSAQSARCPDILKARRWKSQATKDLHMAQSSMAVAGYVSGYNWICYKCHQACEKGLKAAGFAKDANNVKRNSHSLSDLADTLSDSVLAQLVRRLEATLGRYLAMRYPDACDQQHIPSEVYTENQALTALDITKQILDIVSELIE